MVSVNKFTGTTVALAVVVRGPTVCRYSKEITKYKVNEQFTEKGNHESA